MKYRWLIAFAAVLGLAIAGWAQEGPQPSSGDSVAKPKKPAETAPADQAPIPSEYKRPKNVPPADSPTFEANATTVNVDVAVMDDHNHFIPKFRKATSVCWRTACRSRSRVSARAKRP